MRVQVVGVLPCPYEAPENYEHSGCRNGSHVAGELARIPVSLIFGFLAGRHIQGKIERRGTMHRIGQPEFIQRLNAHAARENGEAVYKFTDIWKFSYQCDACQSVESNSYTYNYTNVCPYCNTPQAKLDSETLIERANRHRTVDRVDVIDHPDYSILNPLQVYRKEQVVALFEKWAFVFHCPCGQRWRHDQEMWYEL